MCKPFLKDFLFESKIDNDFFERITTLFESETFNCKKEFWIKIHWCNFQSKTRQSCIVINSIFSKTCFKLFHFRLLEGNQSESGHANSEKALIRIEKDLLDNLNHTYLLLVKRRKKEKTEFFSIKPFRTYQIFVKETFANKFSFFG